MHTASHAAGTFSWFELSTTDQTAAKHFYQTLFGWGATDSPMGPNDFYTMFTLDGQNVAAAYTMRADERAQKIPAHWMIYIAVTDADRAAAKAGELGGKVLAPPFDVMEHGRMAVIQDPTGAVFSIWQAKTHPGTGITGVPHTVCWVDLSTPDEVRAAAFYRGLFGWATTTGSEGHPAGSGEYHHIQLGKEYLGGIQPSAQRNPHAPPHWLIYFAVADCGVSTAKAKSLGARAFVESMQIGENGWMSVLADPQGAVFALHQTKKAQ